MIPLYKPFIPPKSELFTIWEEVLDSGYIAMGEYVERFEKDFGDFIDYHHVVAVNSCTNALQLALKLADVGPSDEVISTPVTAEPTNIAIYHTGASIVWADVDPNTGNIDWRDALTKVTSRTKAVVFVDYMGLPAHDYQMFNIPPEIYLIEDAAHALGARWDNQPVGSICDFTAFSFQAIKHLTTGNGGMLAVSSDLERAQRLRWFGFDKKANRMTDDIVEAGWKWDMTNLQAAMGIVGLRHIERNITRARENYNYLQTHIEGCLYNDRWDQDSPWTFTIFPDDREFLERKLTAAGIGHSRGHRRNDEHPVFGGVADLPGVEQFTSRCLHIPCGWWVTDEDRERIVEVINS